MPCLTIIGMLAPAGLCAPQACRGAGAGPPGPAVAILSCRVIQGLARSCRRYLFSESRPYFRCRAGVAVAGLARQLHPRRRPRARVRLGAVSAILFV